MKKCDIIIPIYNAYDCLGPCIESVIKNTEFENNKLVLIDDKSPDERVLPLLKKYAQEYSFIELLQNTENLGFVGTVNRGMKASNNDVLLLNSDTLVTKGWLDKIKKCAYSMPKVATVTPLSNNATLASVPNSFEPNELPKGMSLEEMGELIEKCSRKDYPEIPTGHGFCLYIKREVLDDVGYFDEESFGKGYGEENDFCFRCLDKGYRHLLCDDTYIYHKESQSFSDSKVALIEDGLKVLKEKYPKYRERLDYWVNIDPLDYICSNIKLALEVQKKRSNILFIIHDWKNIKNNVGGTTLHAYDLIQNMRNKYNFHVLTPEDGIFKVYSYWEQYETEIKYPKVSEFHDLNYYNFDYKKMLSNIIDDFGIGLVHIHHLIGNYFDVVDVIKEKKLYSILTLHDYYCVCPLINKLYKNEEYCDNPSIQKCNECLKAVMKTSQSIIEWRKEWQRVLDSVDLIIAPSNSAKEEIAKNYENHIKVIEHGINIQKEPAKYLTSEKHNIAFIGAIGIHKGSKILEQFMKNSSLKKTKVHLFGTLDSPYQKNTKIFKNHGKYTREELKMLLKKNNIELICLFSTWPETYSYTLTEAIACGIPVLSFDLGAIAERVTKYHLGWTVSRNSSIEEITNKINQILSNTNEYNQVIDAINNYKIKTVEEMSQEYNKIYSKNIKLDSNIDFKHLSKLNKENAKYFNNAVYNNYAWVFDTLKWKIISKFKFPKFIKKIINRNKEG